MSTTPENKPKAKTKAKKIRKNIQSGIAHITASFNNTIVTITDVSGNVVAWSSSGVKGFKGSRKSTPFAAQLAAEDAGHKAMEHGMRSLSVFVRGAGSGRKSALGGPAARRRRGPWPRRASRARSSATSPPSRTTAAGRPSAAGSDPPGVLVFAE